jgi:TRAP-type uncharacterized transport system fused permease subunit
MIYFCSFLLKFCTDCLFYADFTERIPSELFLYDSLMAIISYSQYLFISFLFSINEYDEAKATNFDHILGFVIILVALEATQFIENRKLINKYWE